MSPAFSIFSRSAVAISVPAVIVKSSTISALRPATCPIRRLTNASSRWLLRIFSAMTVFAEKMRKSHREEAFVSCLIGHVAGRNALIVDDFTITAGTLIATAERLKIEKAGDIYAAVAHGVL